MVNTRKAFGNLGNTVQTVMLFAVFGLFQRLSLAQHYYVTCPPWKLTTTGGDYVGCSNLNCFGIDRSAGWPILYNR